MMHVVAIHCGTKGLSVCGISTDPKVRKKAQRKYVVHGFELVKDAAYCGNNKAAALPSMLRRSQVLQTVLAYNPKAHVVSTYCTVQYNTVIGYRVPTLAKLASHGVIRVPRGPICVPQSFRSGVGATEITTKLAVNSSSLYNSYSSESS
jgi:hypothetical protein